MYVHVRIGNSPMSRLSKKNGTAGTSRSVNRDSPRCSACVTCMAWSLRPNRACTQSRSTKRAAKNANVAPTVEANDTSTKPHSKPNSAPPTKVNTAAPGKDKAVTSTYSPTYSALASSGWASRKACHWPTCACTRAKLSHCVPPKATKPTTAATSPKATPSFTYRITLTPNSKTPLSTAHPKRRPLLVYESSEDRGF